MEYSPALLQAGYDLPAVERVTPETPKENFKRSIVIAPPVLMALPG
jgi:putative mRNA 3-end processing factor